MNTPKLRLVLFGLFFVGSFLVGTAFKSEAQTTLPEGQTKEILPAKSETAPSKKVTASDYVDKTYVITSSYHNEILSATRGHWSTASSNGDILSVSLKKADLGLFEDLVNNYLDEKKSILIRIYTIFAVRDIPNPEAQSHYKVKFVDSSQIENLELKGILGELKGIWNFRAFFVDGPSFITIKDGTPSNFVKLFSSNLDLRLGQVSVRGREAGKRNVDIGQVELLQDVEGKSTTLMDTHNMSVKEKGYLVVGVSGLSWNVLGTNQAVILVINAEIK